MAGNLYDDAVEQLADSTPPPTLPPNPYDQTVQDMHAGQTQTLRTSLAQADGTTPDRAADVAKLSQRTGIPAPIIDRNYDTIRRRATLDDTPYRQMLTDSPATSAFLAEPSQAAVAADDHGALGALEWLAKLPGHVIAQSIAENKFGALSAKRILGPLTQDEYDQLDAARYYAGEGARLGAGDSWFRNFLTKGMQTAAALLVPEAPTTVLGGAVGAVVGGGAAAVAGPEAIIPGALAGARYGAGVGYTAGLAGSAFLSGAGSAYDRYLSQTDELGRPMDPDVAKGAALAEGAINAGLMVVGGKIIGKTIEIGGTKLFAKDAIAAALRQPTLRAALGDLVKTYGATLTEGTALNVAMKAGELLVDAGARHAKPGTVPGQTAPGNIDLFQQPKVTNADGSVSTVDSASANIDGQEVLLSRVTPDGRHLSTDEAIAEYQRSGKHLGMFDSPAAADAFAQKLHQDYAAGRYDRPSVVSQLGQAALEGLQSFALVGAVGPALGFVGDLARAKQAAAGPALFNALAEGVTQSKTAQRLPDAAQTFLANAMKDGPVETVYAPIEAWTSYWQSQGVDPAKMATTLTGNADAYAQATRTGEDLAIPTAAYAMKLAATEHNAFFQNELRIGDPAAMNAREAAAFVKQSGQVDEKLNSAPEPAAAVRENILGQLEAAGVERHTAESYATLYEHTFQTLGARAGVDPVELFNRYGLTIGRPDLIDNTRAAAHTPEDFFNVQPATEPHAARDAAAPEEGPGLSHGPGEQSHPDQGGVGQGPSDGGGVDSRRLPAAAALDETFQRRPLADNAARVTPAVRQELQRILDEMETFPFTERTWSWLGPGEGKTGNAAGGDANIVPGSAGAKVYDDVRYFAPVNLVTSGERKGQPAKEVRGTRGDVIAAIRKLLDTDDVHNNLAEGALRVAEHRAAGDYADLNHPELPPSWGPVAPVAFTDALSEAIDAALSDSTDQGGDASFDPAQYEPAADVLPTGEVQPRLPGDVGDVRNADVATPAMEAPFSLSGEVAPADSQQNKLFQQPSPEFVPLGGEAAENADRQAQQDAEAAGQPPLDQLAQAGEADPRKAVFRAATRGKVMVIDQRPQTETDAFRKWFGKSILVDDQGAPRVLYHGTDKNFDTFDVEHAGEGRGSKEERALFFSQTPDTANASAEVMGAGSGGDVVYPVYVKLENPYVSAMKFYDSREMEQEIARAKAEGHDGITFPQLTTPGEADTVAVFSPEQVKSAIGNRGTFDQTDANILHQSEPRKIVRGSISFGADRQFSIELLKHADLTTFLHESGHFFLEVLHDLAQQPDANPGIRADLATLDDWFADEDHTGPGYSVKQHEQFARGFEAYLMEGKAPSAELRPVFARFRAWLVGVYRSLTSLHVQLTDPVREVMDRLVASDDAITQAEAEGHIDPLFTNAAIAGMTPEGFDAYRATVQAASDSAKTELQIKLLRDVQREQQAWWKRERETLRAQVATEMGEQPAYRALTAIQNGTRPDGTPLVDGQEATPLKLAKADLVDRYTPEEMKALRSRRLYAVEGGVHPDVVAQLVGFSSGDDLVRTLLRTPSMKAAIDGETDARMRATHGDLVLDGRLPEAAQAAVYGEGRQQVIQAELRALTAGMVKGTIPPADVINAAAQQRIADTRIRDVRPGQFLMAARRASQHAFDLLATHADRAGAVQAKQQELINLALYREATKAKEAVDSAVTYLRSFDTTATRARIGKAGADYLEQIDGLRARFDLSRQTLTAVDRRQSLAKWAAAKEASTGLPLELPEELLNEARRGHYTDLTVNELQGVRDGVEMIAHLATLKNKLLKLQAGRELAEATGAAVTSIAEHSTGKRAAGIETRLPGSQGSKNIATFFASHRKLSSFLRQMDGFQDGGTMWDGIMRPINEAADAEAVRNEQATIALRRLFEDAYKGEETTLYRKTSIPAIGDSLTKMGQLMVALNWGNDGNRQRIRDGYHWTDDQVRAVLDGLDARDWTFVQGVWDHINSYWSDIAAKERRVTGIAPEKVEATPVATKFGEMPGGYFPLKYDHEQSARAGANLEAGFADGVKQASYVRATTQRGHTEARVAKVSEPVRLDFGVITEHVQQVIHDLTHHETLIDVGRILGHRDVQDAIYEHYGPIVYDQLKGAVRDIAFGNTPAPGWYQTLNAIRAKTVTATLGWNAVTSLLHTLQLTRGMVRVGPGYVTHGLVRWLSSAKNADYSVGWIESQSDMMRLRWKTQQRELNEVRNTVGLDRGKVSAAIHDTLAKAGVDPGAMPAIADSYFYAIRRIVQFAEIPTWIGAYEKAMADSATTPDRAVALANQAVEDSMGSGHIKDLSAVQRAPMARLLTTFYDYHNAVYQQAYELVKNSESPGRKLVDASLLLFAPVAFSAAIYHALAPAPAHPQAATAASTAKEIAEEGADYGLNMFAGLRELSGAFTGRDYMGPAGLRFIPTTRNFLYRLSQEGASGGRLTAAEKASALAKATTEMGGELFGYPAHQIEKTASGVQALWTGKTSKPSALLFGAPAGPK